MSRHYTQTLQLPNSKQEGLANFIQMIINRLETAIEDCPTVEGMREQVRDTLLVAVDLWNDVHCGNYREVTDAGSKLTATFTTAINQAHIDDLAKATAEAYDRGQSDMKAHLVEGLLGRLGLA